MATDKLIEAESLTPTERRLVRLGRLINERPLPKRLQRAFLTGFGMRWVRFCTRNLLQVQGFEHVAGLQPPGGVLVCSNHRSFFDMYVISSVLLDNRLPWARDLYFPVRTTFFYERWAGLAVNLIMGGGSMYPPIFRDRAKAELNKLSVQRVAELLHTPGVVIGMHPEGTRGKGPDPYELLPAQPGVGQMALQGEAPVVPIWISGLGNDLPEQILSNFRTGERKGDPIHINFGPPVELDDLRAQKPRVTLYKRAADRILDRIRDLAPPRAEPSPGAQVGGQLGGDAGGVEVRGAGAARDVVDPKLDAAGDGVGPRGRVAFE